MRSIDVGGHHPDPDLTARARILDAALSEFARHGVKAATMRGIAGAAGVSVGLVQHHFGTKEALRQACDEAVMAMVDLERANTGPEGGLTDPGFVHGLFERFRTLLPYIARIAADGSLGTSALFDRLIGASADYLSTSWPDRFAAGSARTRDAAAVLVAMSLGPYVFHDQIAATMGLPPDDAEVMRRAGLASLDVYRSIGELVHSDFGPRLRGAVEAASAPAHDRPSDRRTR